MPPARVSRWIPLLAVLAACGPFKEAPLEGDPVREDDPVTPASAVYEAEPSEDDADEPEAPEETGAENDDS